ncbi:MAG TPA: hypothetical protein VJ183_16750 [Chloroflexia bacterium]|nr:hypothetical protein [Chloroflexia bacterium]
MNDRTSLGTDTLPIACNLPERELAERAEELEGELFSGCAEIRELEDGYAFRFPGDELWAERLLGFIISERKCCPFFIFELLFEVAEGPIWLRLRGSEGVKEFIEANFTDALEMPSDVEGHR